MFVKITFDLNHVLIWLLFNIRRSCQQGEPGSEGERVETRGDSAVAMKKEREEIENRATLWSRGRARAEEGRGGSGEGPRDRP